MRDEVRLAYEPFPVFHGFHQSTARFKWLLGSVGSGKTIALCAQAIGTCLRYPGIRAGLFRKAATDLRDSTEFEFLSLLGDPGPDDGTETGIEPTTLLDLCKVRRTGGHTDYIEFPNGSQMFFRGMDKWEKRMSLNLGWIGIDEANELTEEDFNALAFTRLRQKFPLPGALRQGYKWGADFRQECCVASNSWGHNWTYRRFIADPLPNGRVFKSTTFDNPTLYGPDGEPDDYLRSLMLMPLVWVRRFVLCDLDAFSGPILEFRPETHVYEHFTPPPDWQRAMGLDWGLRNAVAVVWWARAPGSRIWHQYREWQNYDYFHTRPDDHMQSVSVHMVAQILREIEAGEKVSIRAADPAIWRRQTGDKDSQTVAYWFQRYGFHFQPGAADYTNRINALNQLLHLGELKVSTACPITQMAFEQYRWDDLQPARDQNRPEKPLKKDDHHVDASQYLATIFAGQLPAPSPEIKPPTWDEHVRDLIAKQTRRKAAGTL